MNLKCTIIPCVIVATLLSGCGRVDSASYMIGGAPHSLSLTRTKTFFWSSGWDLDLVTARNPECMRRHKLQPVTGTDFKVELYRSLEGNYIIKQGTNWYVTETQKCRLQQYPTPPREPGDLLGAFEEKEDGIKFVAAATAPPRPAAPVASPATTPPASAAATPETAPGAVPAAAVPPTSSQLAPAPPPVPTAPTGR